MISDYRASILVNRVLKVFLTHLGAFGRGIQFPLFSLSFCVKYLVEPLPGRESMADGKGFELQGD